MVVLEQREPKSTGTNRQETVAHHPTHDRPETPAEFEEDHEAEEEAEEEEGTRMGIPTIQPIHKCHLHKNNTIL